MKLKAKYCSKKLNNKGSAIILVIIAMAFIGILAALILWLAYMNYFMKAMNMRATDTFYTVDMVAEEIRAGLETETAAVAGDAYSTVLQRYSELDTDSRKSFFNTRIVTDLLLVLEDGAGTGKYKQSILYDYIKDATVKTNTTISTGGSFGGAGITPKITVDYINGSLILHDVDIKYEDPQRNYVAVIHTDFRITAPNLDFSDTPVSNELFSYGLIANRQLKVNNTLNLDLCNAYAGGRSVVSEDNSAYTTVYEDIDDAILVEGTLNTRNESRGVAGPATVIKKLVSRKALNLGTDAVVNKSNQVDLHTENIVLEKNGGNLTLDGKSYVADDLTINGKNTVVTLKDSYYGFGTDKIYSASKYKNATLIEEDKTGDDSSAILINGRNSTVDLSGLSNLWLMGRSYVGTRKRAASNKINIPMSESVSIRGDQVAYLVPTECLARWNAGTVQDTWIVRNPMTLTEYNDHIAKYANPATYPNFTECDLSVELEDLGEVSIQSFGTNVTYQTVFTQPNGDSEGLVYYYIVMDAADANTYFKHFYGVEDHKATIDRYANKYVNIIKNVPDTATINIAGNWLSAEQAEGSTPTNNLVNLTLSDPDSQPIDTLSSQLSGFVNQFDCLKSKLVDDNVSTAEKANSAYENLMKDSLIRSFTGDNATDYYTYTDPADATKQYIAIVSTKDVNYTGDPKVRLIISTKDINISGNFEGCAIAKGNINVSGGVTVTNDSTTVSEIERTFNISKTKGGSEVSVYQFFKDGTAFVSPTTTDAANEITVGDMVKYENWTKNGIEVDP